MGILDIIIIIVAWLGGFTFHVAGSLIHLLLIIAVIVLIARFFGLG